MSEKDTGEGLGAVYLRKVALFDWRECSKSEVDEASEAGFDNFVRILYTAPQPSPDVAAMQARQEGMLLGHDNLNAHALKLSEEVAELRRHLADAQAWKNEAAGCFQAANDEGLQDRLIESGFLYGDGTLADLVSRRLIPACPPSGEDTTALDALLAAKERETIEMCIKICDDGPERQNGNGQWVTDQEACVQAIRAVLK